MKESSWESSTEDASEFFDSEALLNDDAALERASPKQAKTTRVTELRRRMELRQDWKRISSEVDYLLDDPQDKLQ